MTLALDIILLPPYQFTWCVEDAMMKVKPSYLGCTRARVCMYDVWLQVHMGAEAVHICL